MRRSLALGAPLASEIRKSSSLCPDWSAATSQRGCLPRPDHVSPGSDGLLYFGRTFGYLRRGARSVLGSAEEIPVLSIRSTGFSCAKRFSSSSFSALIFSERIFVSSSCKSQSSSKSIASRSNLRIALSSLFDGRPSDQGKNPTVKRPVLLWVAETDTKKTDPMINSPKPRILYNIDLFK